MRVRLRARSVNQPHPSRGVRARARAWRVKVAPEVSIKGHPRSAMCGSISIAHPDSLTKKEPMCK